jgi:hypothetical protein
MTKLESFSDLELQQLLIYDDYRAFTVLYGRYSASIHHFLLKILKSAELTGDIVDRYLRAELKKVIPKAG